MKQRGARPSESSPAAAATLSSRTSRHALQRRASPPAGLEPATSRRSRFQCVRHHQAADFSPAPFSGRVWGTGALPHYSRPTAARCWCSTPAGRPATGAAPTTAEGSLAGRVQVTGSVGRVGWSAGRPAYRDAPGGRGGAAKQRTKETKAHREARTAGKSVNHFHPSMDTRSFDWETALTAAVAGRG